MTKYTVKVSEWYYFYEVEADSRDEAKSWAKEFVWDPNEADHYEHLIEVEETEE